MDTNVRWYHVGAAAALGVVVGCLLAVHSGYPWWLGLPGALISAFFAVEPRQAFSVLRRAVQQEMRRAPITATTATLIKSVGQSTWNGVRSARSYYWLLIGTYGLVFVVTAATTLFGGIALMAVVTASSSAHTESVHGTALSTIVGVVLFLAVGIFVVGRTMKVLEEVRRSNGPHLPKFLTDLSTDTPWDYERGTGVMLSRIAALLVLPLLPAVLALEALVRITLFVPLKAVGMLTSSPRVAALLGTLTGFSVAVGYQFTPLGVAGAAIVGFAAGSILHLTSVWIRQIRACPLVFKYGTR